MRRRLEGAPLTFLLLALPARALGQQPARPHVDVSTIAPDGTRWWISAAQWDDERPDNPIPPEYLNAP